MTDMPNLLQDKKGAGEKLSELVVRLFTLDWYFSGFEKIIVALSVLWSMFSLVKLLWGVI